MPHYLNRNQSLYITPLTKCLHLCLMWSCVLAGGQIGTGSSFSSPYRHRGSWAQTTCVCVLGFSVTLLQQRQKNKPVDYLFLKLSDQFCCPGAFNFEQHKGWSGIIILLNGLFCQIMMFAQLLESTSEINIFSVQYVGRCFYKIHVVN